MQPIGHPMSYRPRTRWQVEKRACKTCGVDFTSTREPGRRGRRAKFCTPACRAVRPVRRSVGPVNRKMLDRICAWCQKPFLTDNSRTVCCGPSCGKLRSAAARTANARARNARKCEHCGVDFQSRRPGATQRFCSQDCARRRAPQAPITTTAAGDGE
jgi:hypothetical protein